MKQMSSSLFAVALLGISAFAQSPSSGDRPQSVHIQGTILDPLSEVIPRMKVTFSSDHITRTVVADDKGFYQTDLPPGFYTMTARGEELETQGFGVFRRPLFRVTTATNLTLDGYLNVSRSCDFVQVDIPGAPIADTEDELAEYRKDSCGGADSIPIPSNDGVPFQLYIRYPRRSRSEANYAYDSESSATFETLVLVEYNLFTLQALHVVYDGKHRRLEATGAVSVVDESGKTRRADSMIFKIENGRTTPLNNHPSTPIPRNSSRN